MSQLGADLEELRELAASMRTASSTLEHVARGVDRHSHNTGWRGPDARRFHSEWDDRHRPALLRLARDCGHLAGSLDDQARQQQRASTDLLAVTPAGPEREVRFSGSLEATVASVNVALQGELSFEELEDGKVRVGFSRGAGVGVAGSIGATVDLGIGSDAQSNMPATGARAEGKARVGAVERHSWVVDEDEVPFLLAKLAAAQADDALGNFSAMDARAGDTSLGPLGLARALGTAADVVDGAARLLTGHDPGLDDLVDQFTTIPAPERSEHLAQLELTGNAGGAIGSLLGAGANVTATGTWRVGGGTTRDTTSVIAEFHGNASAAVGGSLLRRFGVYLPADANAEVSQRFEYVRGPRGEDHVLIETSTTVGSELEERTVRIDLGDEAPEQVRRGLRNAIDRLTKGDPQGAALSFAFLHEVAFNADDIEITERLADVTSSNLRGKASVGEVLSFGISARGRKVEIERR